MVQVTDDLPLKENDDTAAVTVGRDFKKFKFQKSLLEEISLSQGPRWVPANSLLHAYS